MKLHNLLCHNPACGMWFEHRAKTRLYCCSECATAVNRTLPHPGRKRRETSGLKRGKRIYSISGL